MVTVIGRRVFGANHAEKFECLVDVLSVKLTRLIVKEGVLAADLRRSNTDLNKRKTAGRNSYPCVSA